MEAAIDWLCEVLGFEKRRVLTTANGAIHYAELGFGDSMIMLGPVQDSVKLMAQPEDVGGAVTQICYLFVEDAGAHYARAKGGGAEIVLDIEAERSGSRVTLPAVTSKDTSGTSGRMTRDVVSR